MKVILEQWFSALQLLRKDFRNELMRQVSNTNHLVYTWMVKIKGEESIKREGSNERKGSRNQERNTVAIRNQLCNQTCEKYIRTNLLGLCRERFSLV